MVENSSVIILAVIQIIGILYIRYSIKKLRDLIYLAFGLKRGKEGGPKIIKAAKRGRKPRIYTDENAVKHEREAKNV